MTTQEVATRLTELCRKGQYDLAHDELYHPEAESLEPDYSPTPYAKGREALRQKGLAFSQGVQEVHNEYVSEALVAGNFISFTMGMDVTMKDGNRMQMDEVAVYEVKDGKVVKEQFFY
jgi:ketosteroid isomerase-like protein